MPLPPVARCTAQASRPLPAALRGLAPPDVVARLRGLHAPWLLESALALPRTGRWSFAGADPYLVMRARGDEVELEGRRAVHPGVAPGRRRMRAPALEVLRRCLPAPPPETPEEPFCGGAVGLFGYELAEQLDVHRLHGADDLGLPLAVWLFVDAVVVFDHARGEARISGTGFADDPARARARAERAADALAERLVAGAPRPPRRGAAPAAAGPRAELDLAGYRKAVDAAAHDIAAGEIYQACLTYRIDRPYGGDPFALYGALRRLDPAPFAAFLELPELAIASSSPERFLRVGADGRVESRPIKGTAPRGRHPAEDAANRRALETSEKDRAENLMIVDLVRNDLGRVCGTGTVHVPELMVVEPYAAVFQLVSTVAGRLRAGCDVLDAVAATFPPGSMTGAPKIAAMRVLDRLESVRRGFYAGALGYLDARGGADLSVVIRTAFVKDGRAYLHAGGGIVADSEPAAELAESRAKLRPLLAALDECAGGTTS